MISPKHTLQSVVRELREGLENGTIMLDSQNESEMIRLGQLHQLTAKLRSSRNLNDVSPGIEQFKVVLKDFRDMSSLALKGTLAAPVINFWTKLGPPPAPAVTMLTSLMGFIAVVWTFHFWYGMSKRRLGSRMVLCVVVFCGTLLASGVLFDLFTVRPGGGRDLVVCGYSVLPDIRPLMTGDYTPLRALRESEYDAGRVWTRTSITVVHLALILCWLMAFASLILLCHKLYAQATA
jgi:hypothetical protein